MTLKKLRQQLEDFTSLSEKHILILKDNGILTIDQLANRSILQIKNLLSTTLNKATAIHKEARNSLPPFKIVNAKMILDSEMSRQYISLGCKALDALLGGKGIETGSITEFYARFGCGKSQIAFTAIVRSMLKKPYGLEGSVLVIDTEGTFSATRLLQIKKHYEAEMDMSDDQFLKNIIVIRPLKSLDQSMVIKNFLDQDKGYTKYVSLQKPLKLVVIDSLTNLFRSEYLGLGALSERQQKLNQHIRQLYLFGVKQNAAIIVTNQVISNPDPYSPDHQIAVGGNVIAHATTYRIALRKRKGYRVATMIDSSRLPAGEALFKITRKGVVDLTDEDDSQGSLQTN